MSYGKPEVNEEKLQEFLARLTDDVGTCMLGALCYIGDKLKLFQAMASSGPITADELAQKTNLSRRYISEWLSAMACARYIEYDAQSRCFYLPVEHALPLADESSPYFFGGLMQELVPAITQAPKIAEAFKSGLGVSQDQYDCELFEGIERTTGPWYRHRLVQDWLPLMPQVVAALDAGAHALDVGCGAGHAAIRMALAYPNARFFGFDSFAKSIAKANANAAFFGVAERVEFSVRDGIDLPGESFEFISLFDVVHDSKEPLALLKSVRAGLKEGGTCLMLEMNGSSRLEENISPLGKLLYSLSVLYCLTTSLAQGGEGIGTIMGEEKAGALAEAAGFKRFRKLPVDDPFSLLFELRA